MHYYFVHPTELGIVLGSIAEECCIKTETVKIGLAVPSLTIFHVGTRMCKKIFEVEINAQLSNKPGKNACVILCDLPTLIQGL